MDRFSIEEPSAADVAFLEDKLYEFNSGKTGIDDGKLLGVFLRDGSGSIIAGAAGHTWGETCELLQVWVAESARGHGFGRQLVAEAESEAMNRGCRQILLSTYSFQAPEFYQKLGFEIITQVRDYPRGHSHLILRKVLAPVRPISLITEADLPRAFDVWESSVRETHSFLSPEQREQLVPLVKEELASFRPIHVLRDKGEVYALLGVQDSVIEMLFIHADHRGQGGGRILMRYAIDVLGANEVTVNEQNPLAIGFYEHFGFRTHKRTATDGFGNPYPILHMKLEQQPSQAPSLS